MPLFHVKGALTALIEAANPQIIAHICNDVGRWSGSPAALISKQWPGCAKVFGAWYRSKPLDEGTTWASGRCGLGETLVVQVDEATWVASIIGQHGMGMGAGGRPPIRYDAVRKGLVHVQRQASIHQASVLFPKVCVQLAGGHWGNVEALLKSELANRGVEVFAYES